MNIVLTKILVPMTIVKGVKTYREHYLQMYTVYDDNGLVDDEGFAPSGMMELEPNLKTGYDETNENIPETAPLIDPNFIAEYDNLLTVVEV